MKDPKLKQIWAKDISNYKTKKVRNKYKRKLIKRIGDNGKNSFEIREKLADDSVEARHIAHKINGWKSSKCEPK